MKKHRYIFVLLIILCASCAGQNAKVIFHPPPEQNVLQDQAGSAEVWEIIESQNGPGETGVPRWVARYYNRELRLFETTDVYGSKYLFIGKIRGNNFSALQQWVNGFNVAQALPGLIAQRVERRLIVSAALYPDDEYGEYFENLIKKVSDSEYPGTLEEPIFWVKRKMVSGGEESAEDVETERYEFLALIGINRETLHKQLEEIMTTVKTTVPPTRDQTAAINKIRQSFFEGF